MVETPVEMTAASSVSAARIRGARSRCFFTALPALAHSPIAATISSVVALKTAP